PLPGLRIGFQRYRAAALEHGTRNQPGHNADRHGHRESPQHLGRMYSHWLDPNRPRARRRSLPEPVRLRAAWSALLLTDAECPEHQAQDIVWRRLSGDLAQGVQRFLQVQGQELWRGARLGQQARQAIDRAAKAFLL